MYKKILLLLSIPMLTICMEKAENQQLSQYDQDIKALFDPLSDLAIAEELIQNHRFGQAIKLLNKVYIASDNHFLQETLINRKKLLQSIACYYLGIQNNINNPEYYFSQSKSLLTEVLGSTQLVDEYHQSALKIKELFCF